MSTTIIDARKTTPAWLTELVERLTGEVLIGTNAAARYYGTSRDTSPTHATTVARHMIKGVRLPDGTVVKLEAIRIGSKLMTSKAAVLRFFAAQQQVTADPTSTDPNPSNGHKKTSKAAEQATAQLDAEFGARKKVV